MKIEIAGLEELLQISNSVLCWGPPTTGKTSSLATLAPKYLPLWCFDFDWKSTPLIHLAKEGGWLDKLVIFRYKRTQGRLNQLSTPTRNPQIFLDFLKDFNALQDQVDPQTGLWRPTFTQAPKSIIFDSLTSLGDVVLDFVLATVGHELGAPGTDARSDFGKQMSKIMEIVKSSKTLPCLSVWVAHEKFIQDELTGQVRCLPSATGLLANTLAKEFNVVLYSQVVGAGDKAKYEWLVRPKGWVQAAGTTARSSIKDRGELPMTVPQDFQHVL